MQRCNRATSHSCSSYSPAGTGFALLSRQVRKKNRMDFLDEGVQQRARMEAGRLKLESIKSEKLWTLQVRMRGENQALATLQRPTPTSIRVAPSPLMQLAHPTATIRRPLACRISTLWTLRTRSSRRKSDIALTLVLCEP